MQNALLELPVDKEPRGVEAQHARPAGAHPDGMDLRVETFQPRLAERVLQWQ